MRVAHVIVDIPTRALHAPFDYAFDDATDVRIGMCVLVDFAGRPVVGYVVGVSQSSDRAGLKSLSAVLGGPFFSETSARLARWISAEYVCPLSEAVRLFTPPGGTPRAVNESVGGRAKWSLRMPGVGPVDDRWAIATSAAHTVRLRANATMQRAVLDALSDGPVRVAELSADLGSVDGALASLTKRGAVVVERRRRLRDGRNPQRDTPRHEQLTKGQGTALQAIEESAQRGGGVIVLDGVTGSGKTEVYLRAIEAAIKDGGTACVLVPEISLTPQTVGRFRGRFGDDVAVLHSRLSAGERFDQWDRVRTGDAHIVVGARSALFAPLSDIRLIVIDEEHDSSYKQASSPRYHARDVAARLAREHRRRIGLGKRDAVDGVASPM